MSHRTPLRIFLLALGAMALGIVGAVLLGRGSAEAAVASTPPPALGISVNGGSVTVGPVVAELPVPLPVAEPIQVGVPLPAVVAPIVNDLPLVGGITQTPIHLGLPVPIALPALPAVPVLPVPIALPGPVTLPTSLPGATTIAPVSSPFAALVEAFPVARSIARVRSLGSTVVTTTVSMLDGATSGTPALPTLPSIPWTLAFGGLAAGMATAGADGSGGKRSLDATFVAVFLSARRTAARLRAALGPARPDPSRPGFALLFARPG